MNEIKRKIVANYKHFVSESNGLAHYSCGWTWIVEPEGYSTCVTDEELKSLVGKTLKVIEMTDEEFVLEIVNNVNNDREKIGST